LGGKVGAWSMGSIEQEYINLIPAVEVDSKAQDMIPRLEGGEGFIDSEKAKDA
jgi:hypothetical protein